jgi:phosphoribosylglycinamide formyltransferase-1
MSVVMLAGRGPSTWMVANSLLEEISLSSILLESPPSRWQALRRRAAKLGWWTVAGQVLFSLYARRLQAQAAARAAEILQENGLQTRRPTVVPILDVPSANSEETIRLLQRLAPKVVVVNGTRILSRRLLESVDAPFLNLHVGITPKYRGVHGAYWALVNRDLAHAGVTVHLVDPGIDTGSILYQARIEPAERDNFTTYPLLQIAAGLPLLKRAIQDALAGTVRPRPAETSSRLYYPPTLWQYWFARVRLGVK